MAKAKPSLCKTKGSDNKNKKTMKKKKTELEFSESEIDVAEQLIQLSGDSDNDNNNNNDKDNNIHEEIISAGDTTHPSNDTDLNRVDNNLFDDQEDGGFDPRKKKKRIKSLSEIYSLTCKPLSDNFAKNVR